MIHTGFSVVIEKLPKLLLASLAMIGMATGGRSLASVIGLFGVMVRRAHIVWLRALFIGFVELKRYATFRVQIFFAAPQLGVRLSPTATVTTAMALNRGA